MLVSREKTVAENKLPLLFVMNMAITTNIMNMVYNHHQFAFRHEYGYHYQCPFRFLSFYVNPKLYIRTKFFHNGAFIEATSTLVTVMVEAQKCLCNIIFNSSPAQRVCSANGCVEGIVQRLKTYQDPELTQELKVSNTVLICPP